MITNKAVVAIAAAGISAIAMVWAAGCDGRGPEDDSDTKSGEAPRVPLGVIDVPEGTPDGEWLEIGGDTPLLWCYRGGKRLVFKQAGPKVYLSLDGSNFSLAGIIVRSREEMLLLNDLPEDTRRRLTLWIYSPHLVHLKEVSAPESIDSIHVWEWGRGLLTDLSPLTRTTQLTSLCIRDCPKLTDLSPLKSLGKLSSLNMQRAAVSDVSPIVNLPLAWLDIRSNKLTPASAGKLAEFTHLETLKVSAYDANGAAVPLAAVLPKLPSLETLTVLCSEQPDGEGGALAPIGMLPKLSSLALEGLGRKPDFSEITSLKNLTSLQVTAVMKQLKMDLTPLSQITSLRGLKLEVKNGRTLEDTEDGHPNDLELEGHLDLAALKALRGLTHLEVHCDGGTVGHESLAELPALQHFILRSSGEVTVPEFSRPGNLRVVEFASPLSWTRDLHLQSFDRIGRLTNLESLTVRGCSLERKRGEGQNLKALASLQKLRILDLSHSDLFDLSPLRELAQLQVLYLRDYGLHPDYPALDQLADLGQLIELDLSQSRAGAHRAFDLAPLARLKRLQRIELDLADVEGGSLPSWPALRSASLPRNITDQGLEDFVREHPHLVRLRARGGGSTTHEPLKADLSPIRKLTNLSEIELECDDLSLMGNMNSLTKVLTTGSMVH